MMFSDNGKISLRQLQCLIISDFTAVYMAVIPLILFKKNIDGIAAELIISFVAALAILYAVTKLKGSKKNTAVLKALSIFLFVKTVFVNGVYLGISQDVISEFLFNGEDKMISAIFLLAAAVFICMGGIESRGRMAEITAFIIFLSPAFSIPVFSACMRLIW